MGQNATANLFYGVYVNEDSIEHVGGVGDEEFFDFDELLDELSGFSEEPEPYPGHNRNGEAHDAWLTRRKAYEARRKAAHVAHFGANLEWVPLGYECSGFAIAAMDVEVRWGPEPFVTPEVDVAAANKALKMLTDILDAADNLLRVYRWLETDSPTLAKIVRDKIGARRCTHTWKWVGAEFDEGVTDGLGHKQKTATANIYRCEVCAVTETRPVSDQPRSTSVEIARLAAERDGWREASEKHASVAGDRGNELKAISDALNAAGVPVADIDGTPESILDRVAYLIDDRDDWRSTKPAEVQTTEALAAAQATLADVEATIGGAMRPGMTLAQAVREAIQAAGAVDPDPGAFGAIQSRIIRGGVDNVRLEPDELRTIIQTQPAWRPEKGDTEREKNVPLTAWACVSEAHVSTAKLTAPSLAKQLVLREMASRALNALSFLFRAKSEGRPADPKALAFAMKALGYALDVTTAEDTASP